MTLTPNRWYAWEMLPGYAGIGRYYSPIQVHRVEPLRTGRNELRLAFYNAGYAEGVRGFEKTLRILHRAPEYILARILYDPQHDPNRCAIITPLTRGWLNLHFAAYMENHPELQSMTEEELEEALTKLL
jgi:hypothetical protein